MGVKGNRVSFESGRPINKLTRTWHLGRSRATIILTRQEYHLDLVERKDSLDRFGTSLNSSSIEWLNHLNSTVWIVASLKLSSIS